MIEGLMASPWFRNASRQGLGISDCKSCKASTPQLIRMSMGCGYEPPADGRVHLTLWQPPSGSAGYQGEPLTVCAGYTCNLPEVLETGAARVHWSKGNLSMLDGPEDLLDAILILESQHNQLQSWLMTPVKDGGGRE